MYNINKNYKTLFLTKNSKFDYKQKVNLILSAQLYWVRVFEIPISSYKDAIKVVPSFFEDFLDIEQYKFYAIKLNDTQYLCFAYNQTQIIETIKQSNLSLSQINNIYFAHNEFLSYNNDQIFKLDDQYMIYKDDILVLIPSSFIKSQPSNYVDLDNIKLSKHKIYIQNELSFLDTKSAYILSIIFILLIIVNGIKLYQIKKTTKILTNNLQLTKQTYHLMPTIIQTKSVIRSLKDISSKQIKVREALNYIFNFSKITKGQIQRIDLSENKILIYFIKIDSFNKLKSYISKKYPIYKSINRNDVITIGIKL